MKQIYRTMTFWGCIGGFFVNLPMLYIAIALHERGLQQLHLLSMAAFVVGAGSHWYLDRLYTKKKR